MPTLLRKKTKRSITTKRLLSIPEPAAATQLHTCVSANLIPRSQDLATVSSPDIFTSVTSTDIAQHSSSTASIIKPKSSRRTLASPIQRSQRSSVNSGATRQSKSRPSGKPSPRKKSSATNSSTLITATNQNVTVVAAASRRTRLAQPSRN